MEPLAAQAEGGPPAPPAAATDDTSDIHRLRQLVDELRVEVRQLKAFQRHQESSWGQRVFLVQPDSGNTLYSESNLSYSGTNPTTAPLSDQTGTIARSFLQGDIITPAADAATVMEFDNGTQRAYVKLPGGDMRYVRLESAGGAGTYTGKLMSADGSGTLTATTNTATVYELNKTAAGYNLGTGSNCTVVSIDNKNEFRSSIVLYNNGTFIANVGGLTMAASLYDVMRFNSSAQLVLNPGNAYEVVQMDSTAAKLVILPVRAL